MKKVFLCFLDAFEAYEKLNQKIKEKLQNEYKDFEVKEIYTIKMTLQKIIAGDIPDVLIVVDLPGISGSELLIKQILKVTDIGPEIIVICDQEETIKRVHNLGIENVKKASDILGIRQKELEIF